MRITGENNMKKVYRFTASWCGPCKAMAKILEGANTKGIPIEVVDIDVHPELAATYRVRSVPTLIMVDEDGQSLKMMVGVKSESIIKEWLND
jgi:thioredoxin 1